MRVILLACAALVFATADARAAFQVTYSFTGQPGDQPFTPVTSVTPGSGITASNLIRGTGLIPAAGPGSMNSSGWTTANALDPNDYYSFTLTAAPGSTFDLATLKYGDQRDGDGPTSVVIRTSFDGFLSNVESYTTSESTINESIDLSSLTNLSSIEIRIYAFNALSPTGTYRLNNGEGDDLAGGLVVSGNVTSGVNAVPAPASIVLFALGAPAVLLARRRRAA